SLRIVSLDEAEHFTAQSSCQRRYAPMAFGILPECRSASLRNKRSASPESPPKSASGVMQRLGVALLACTLVIGGTGSASANEARNEAAVRALGDTFAKAFVQKSAELRASLF